MNGTDSQYYEQYFYTASPTTGPTGTYQGGQLTNVSTDRRSDGHFMYGYAYYYTWTTQALQSQIAYNNGSTSNTYLTYDGNNTLTSASVGGSPSSTVSYVYNAAGEVLDRTSSGGSTVAAEYFYISGHQIGQVGNAGPTS